MKYLLDTNIVIAAISADGERLRMRMGACSEDDLVISAIVYAELAYGSARGKPPRIDILRAFLQDIPVLPFDDKAGDAYAELSFVRASYDRLIAAHALSLGLTLVTSNARDFTDIAGLKIENWTL